VLLLNCYQTTQTHGTRQTTHRKPHTLQRFPEFAASSSNSFPLQKPFSTLPDCIFPNRCISQIRDLRLPQTLPIFYISYLCNKSICPQIPKSRFFSQNRTGTSVTMVEKSFMSMNSYTTHCLSMLFLITFNDREASLYALLYPTFFSLYQHLFSVGNICSQYHGRILDSHALMFY